MKSRRGNSCFDFLSNNQIVKSKRSQEEIVGFALIVVIVVVIALVFLMINIRGGSIERESLELNNFLTSALKYTTNCTRYSGSYYNLKELIVACSEGSECQNNQDSCKVLNQSFYNILETSYPAGENSTMREVILDVYYNTSDNRGEILKIKFGEECNTKKLTASNIIPSDFGNIFVDIKTCG